jgi:Ca2+-binding RTX toxin-like protein
MKSLRRAPRARPRLDRLEDRCTPTATLVGTTLTIAGTAGNDNVLVSRLRVAGVDTIRVREVAGTTTTRTDFAASSVTAIDFDGAAGNDRLVSLVSLATTADGGEGNDFLSTAGGADTLNGGPGNDALHGGRGGDTINGDDGNDVLVAGLDREVNTLTGGLGRDTLIGSLGNDVLNAGTGGTAESDTDRNLVFGNFGNDTITGGNGDDVLAGNFGNDTVSGGAGNDRLFGGFGTDTLDGGEGDDHLDGGFDFSVDTLTGGAGNDRFRTFGFAFFREDTVTDFGVGTDTRTRFPF